MRGCVVATIAAGCGFTPSAGPSIDGGDPTGDAPPSIDAAGDDDGGGDAMLAMVIFANRDDDLYTVDVDTQTVVPIGTITDGTITPQIDALAVAGGVLLGSPPAGNRLFRIDPATAAITSGPTLTPSNEYYGLTVAPAGQAGPDATVFAATDDPDGRLYTIDLSTNVATPIGTLGSGVAIAGDIVWVSGRGLYAAINGGACSGVCIATVDAATGTATILSQSLQFITSLSFHRGVLYGFVNSTAGEVYRIDLDTGDATLVFSTGIGFYDST